MLSEKCSTFIELSNEFESAQKNYKKGISKIPLALKKVIKETDNFHNFSKKIDVTRETLYYSLSEKGNPRLYTLLTILDALDLKLKVVPKKH